MLQPDHNFEKQKNRKKFWVLVRFGAWKAEALGSKNNFKSHTLIFSTNQAKIHLMLSKTNSSDFSLQLVVSLRDMAVWLGTAAQQHRPLTSSRCSSWCGRQLRNDSEKRWEIVAHSRNSFMSQSIKLTCLGAHEFLWLKFLDLKLHLNVVIVYFASGVEAADNQWNSKLWDDFVNITSLQTAGKFVLATEDLMAHIKHRKQT